MRRQVFCLALILLVTLPGLMFGRTVTIPAGTPLNVRVIDNLSSESSRPGQMFRGTLATPVVINGETVFAKGANVSGRVVSAHPSGRLSDPGVLELALVSISRGSAAMPVTAPHLIIKGESHTNNNATKIAGGAAAGGILGAIFGGGKGAAIGAGAGAAGGTVVAAATGKKPARVESEAVLSWTVDRQSAVTWNDAPEQQRPQERPRYREVEDRPRHHHHDGDGDRDDDDDDDRGERGDRGYRETSYYFGERDRSIIRNCMMDSRSSLPPGLAKKDRLPPGLERQLERNGTLPPGLQKRVQPLPYACEERLVRLPQNWVRVVLSGRIILLDPGRRIVDLFWLERD